jgi:beta propeller repeat protein
MRPVLYVRLIILCLVLLFAAVFILAPSSASGTQTLITTQINGFNHQIPKIFNDEIVWQDFAYDANGNGLGIIFAYNITSGIETQITDNSTYTTNPAIYDNLITYTDCGADYTCGSGSTIFIYNITTGTRIPLSSEIDDYDNSAIYGNQVVWQNTSSVSGIPQIYYYNTSSGITNPVYPTGNSQLEPAIYDELVVWKDLSGNPEIYLFNLSSNMGAPISDNSGGQDQAFPVIYGNRIVWQDKRNGNYEIFINGTAPGDEYSLTPNEPTVNHMYPAISGNWTAWMQSNVTSGYIGTNDIFVNDTSIYQKIPIALNLKGIAGGPFISYSPINSLYRIVWDEQDASTNNVYLYTSGSTVTCPVANFTNNFAGGSAPVTVNFNDASSFSLSNPITHWFWDFGDGTNSSTLDEGYTNHIYNANGAYDVSLTVSNSYCRNTTTVSNSVVIGAPVADFTASSTSGVAPATITFTDTSLGNPNEWNWSWGDGSWTNGTTPLQQNPGHIYQLPGNYTVSLTATNSYGSNTLTKTNYITISAGANSLENTAINGLSIQYQGSQQYLVYNYTTLPNWTFYPNSSVLDFEPPSMSGFQNISIYTSQSGGFLVFLVNTTITGPISGVQFQTTPICFSDSTGGAFGSINYSIHLSSYPVNALLNTQMWEGVLHSDAINFSTIAIGSHYEGTNGTAFTTKIVKTNFPTGGTAKLYFGVNASLVTSKPFGINEVFVERIDDSGTYGQVLGTYFLYYNSTNNLDYFEADSPNGLSTFGLSFLEGSGNLFQIITLAVSNEVQSQEQRKVANGLTGTGNSPETYAPTAVQTSVVPHATTAAMQTVANPSITFNPIPAPPAPTALSTDVGIIGWLAETFGGHIYLIAAAVIAVVSLIYVRRRRRRFDPLG